jgi:hypothetical protein
MLPKQTQMKYNDDDCIITYLQDHIDKNETQFNVVEVKTTSGIQIWDEQLTIHYYPLKDKDKTSFPFYVNEDKQRLKLAIIAKILEAERIPL